MKELPDWNQWILKKNADIAQEELSKAIKAKRDELYEELKKATPGFDHKDPSHQVKVTHAGEKDGAHVYYVHHNSDDSTKDAPRASLMWTPGKHAKQGKLGGKWEWNGPHKQISGAQKAYAQDQAASHIDTYNKDDN